MRHEAALCRTLLLSMCLMEPFLLQVYVVFCFFVAHMRGKCKVSVPRNTGAKRKRDSTSVPSTANYCTSITAAARAAQFLDGTYEGRSDGFMWCSVCDVVGRHEHKNLAVSHMNYNTKHKAHAGDAKKTPWAKDESQPQSTPGSDKAELEVHMNAEFTCCWEPRYR